MTTINPELLGAILNIQVDSVGLENQYPDTIWPLSQYGWDRGKPTFANCEEYRSGINIYELTAKAKAYCDTFGFQVLSGFNKHTEGFVVNFNGTTFYPLPTEFEAVMTMAGYLFDLETEIRYSDLMGDNFFETVKTLVFRFHYFGCFEAIKEIGSIHRHLVLLHKMEDIEEEVFVESVFEMIDFIRTTHPDILCRVRFIDDKFSSSGC